MTSYDFQPVSKPITLECAKIDNQNKLKAVPRYEQAGYTAAEIVSIEHTSGFADGTVELKIVNPVKITGHSYEMTFSDSMINIPDPSKLASTKFWHLMDLNTGQYVIDNSDYFGDWGPVDIEPAVKDGFWIKTAPTHIMTKISSPCRNIHPLNIGVSP